MTRQLTEEKWFMLAYGSRGLRVHHLVREAWHLAQEAERSHL